MRTAYGTLGWDHETGVPVSEKLQELDVGWAASHVK